MAIFVISDDLMAHGEKGFMFVLRHIRLTDLWTPERPLQQLPSPDIEYPFSMNTGYQVTILHEDLIRCTLQ